MNNNVEIKNLTKFAKLLAKQSCRDIGINIKEIKNYISVKQAKNIVLQYCIIDSGRFILNKKRMDKIQKELCDWIYGVQLSKLSGEDKLDCYWDDDKNKMMFIKK